jgi:hypothetical protein
MSCPCNICPSTPLKNVVGIEKPIPSSLGLNVFSNPVSPVYNCVNKVTVLQQQEPQCLKGSPTLNRLGLNMQTNQYVPMINKKENKVVYAGSNTLLIDPIRAQLLMLDRPHLTGTLPVGDVPKDQIYTKEISKYGGVYQTYGDINAGNIQYYLSKDISDPYYLPNFITPSIVKTDVWIDPMSNIKPQYPRQSLKAYGWDPCNKDDCDSFTHDSLEFRQELMELQQRKVNQQRYSNRWGYIYS